MERSRRGAKLVAGALEQLGVAAGSIAVDWEAAPAEGNGVTDADNRCVVIDIAM